MLSLNMINEYVDTVCQQIRWKRAHIRISEEMKHHIIDGRDSYMVQGLDEKSATEKAIEEAGDAMAIGIQLDRVHRPKPQWSMFAVTAILLLLGILIRLFAFNDTYRIDSLPSRLLYTGIGIGGMLIAYFTDFTIMGKYPKIIYFGTVLSSIAVFFVSPMLTGRSYHAQYIILLFPLAFSAIIFVTRNKGYLGIFLCGIAFALLGGISLYILSISSFLHLTIIGGFLLGIAIHKKWFGTKRIYSFLLMFTPPVLLVIIFLLNMTEYSWDRLAIAFHPSNGLNGTGYMGTMVRELLSGAAFWGRGDIPGSYIAGLMGAETLFHTDLLLTAVISTLGWIPFMVIFAVLLFFIVKGFMLCFRQKSSLGLFVSLAIMMTFCAQVFSYTAFNLGFLFVSPLSLPLVSYGNTATIINLVLIGFMLSVFRMGDVVEDWKISKVADYNRFISWNDGMLTINFKSKPFSNTKY